LLINKIYSCMLAPKGVGNTLPCNSVTWCSGSPKKRGRKWLKGTQVYPQWHRQMSPP
jgi:hypothetical protein